MIRFSSKSKMDSFNFSDEELRIAAQAVRNAMVCALPDASKCQHTFSERFLRKMRPLFQIDRRGMQRKAVLRHVAVFIIGIFITATLFLAFNPQARADFVGWIRSTYERSIFYQFFSENSAESQEPTLPEVEFTWLPGEYEKQQVYNDGQKAMLLLSSDEGTLVLEYMFSENADYVEVFTEGYNHGQTMINGKIADTYWGSDQDNSNALVWMNNDETVVFNLTGAHPIETLVTIAEGIIEK